MRFLPVCFAIFAVYQTAGQQHNPQNAAGAALTRASFNASGLAYEKQLIDFYAGNFVEIEWERSDVVFLSLFNDYLFAYGRRCDAYLPANKVELKRTVCARENYTVDRYGNRVGTSTCAEYRTEGTGVYADPALYAAQEQFTNAVGVDTMRQAFRSMTGKNPLGAALDALGATQRMEADMNGLVRINACNSPGLKRFQDNLVLYALGKQPIRLPGESAASPAPSRPSPNTGSRNQDLTKLVGDLVLEQSKTWLMNRFVAGSVSNVVVASRDGAGRPSKLTAAYLFNGQQRGSVTVSFSDGVPECLYFFDLPSTCRTANRRIAQAYANGAYGQ